MRRFVGGDDLNFGDDGGGNAKLKQRVGGQIERCERSQHAVGVNGLDGSFGRSVR